MKLKRFARLLEDRLLPRQWVLWRRLRRTNRFYRGKMAELESSRTATSRDLDSHHAEWRAEAEIFEEEIRSFETWRLLRKASRLNIPTPRVGDENWEQGGSGEWSLTSTGYSRVRGAIREERRARREMWLAWLPLITAISGLIGMLTGLAAILRK